MRNSRVKTRIVCLNSLSSKKTKINFLHQHCCRLERHDVIIFFFWRLTRTLFAFHTKYQHLRPFFVCFVHVGRFATCINEQTFQFHITRPLCDGYNDCKLQAFFEHSNATRAIRKYWPLFPSKSESNGCCYFRNSLVFAIFAKLIAFSLNSRIDEDPLFPSHLSFPLLFLYISDGDLYFS